MRIRGAREAMAIIDGDGRPCLLFGDIGSTAGGFYDVLSFLGHVRWRGELVIESEGVLRSLYFDEGHVVAASSTAKDEAIGEVLVTAGRLSREQCDACLDKLRDAGLRFGEAAVALGYLTNEELFADMGRQVEAVFTGVVKTATGSFVFLHGYDEDKLAFRRRHHVDGLLLDAIRAIDEASVLPEQVRASEKVPMRTSTRPPASDPLGLYERIDGKATVGEIVESTGKTELEATKALLELVQTGHVTIAPSRIGAARIVEVYNEPLAVLGAELDAMGVGATVREELAKFAAEQQNAHLVRDAGPRNDGTFDAARIVANVEGSQDVREAEERLTTLLYDYASYALFLGRPHLHRRETKDEEPRVSTRVAAMLEAIAPLGETMKGKSAGSSPIPPPPPAPEIEARVAVAKSEKAEPAPPSEAPSSKREKRGFPGVDPTRTVRMPALSEERLAALKASRMMPAFVPPSLGLPPAASKPPEEPRSPRAEPPKVTPQEPSKRPIGLVIACVALAIALVGTWVKSARSDAPTELAVVCETCEATTIDGKEATGATEVTPGSHQVVAKRKGGGPPTTLTVTLREHESRTIVIDAR